MVAAIAENIENYYNSTQKRELKRDIREFGGDKLIDAIVVQQCGVDIYKDYDFAPIKMELEKGERVVRTTASALLEIFKQQNKIL